MRCQVGPLPQQTYQQTVWPLPLLWLSPKIGQLIFLWQSLEDLEAGTSSSRKASTFYGYWAMLKAGAKLPNWLIHLSRLIHTIPYYSILIYPYLLIILVGRWPSKMPGLRCTCPGSLLGVGRCCCHLCLSLLPWSLPLWTSGCATLLLHQIHWIHRSQCTKKYVQALGGKRNIRTFHRVLSVLFPSGRQNLRAFKRSGNVRQPEVASPEAAHFQCLCTGQFLANLLIRFGWSSLDLSACCFSAELFQVALQSLLQPGLFLMPYSLGALCLAAGRGKQEISWLSRTWCNCLSAWWAVLHWQHGLHCTDSLKNWNKPTDLWPRSEANHNVLQTHTDARHPKVFENYLSEWS